MRVPQKKREVEWINEISSYSGKTGKRRKRKEWPEWGTEWEVTTEAETERSEIKDSQEKREGEMGAEGRTAKPPATMGTGERTISNRDYRDIR